MRKYLVLEDMRGTFGCARFEEEILEQINDAIASGTFPNFKLYNTPEASSCACRNDECVWDEKEIISRLKAKGIWFKIEAILAGSI